MATNEELISQRDELRAKRAKLVDSFDVSPAHREAERIRREIVERPDPEGKLAARRAELLREHVAEYNALTGAINGITRELKKRGIADRMAELEGATDEELERARHTLGVELKACTAEIRAVSAVIGDRYRKERIRKLVAGLSDADKAALAQEIGAKPIKSAERIGAGDVS
jgi:hypothetical protein